MADSLNYFKDIFHAKLLIWKFGVSYCFCSFFRATWSCDL